MAYTTIELVKSYLGIPEDETSDDDLLAEFVADAQTTIDLFFLRTFEASADTTRYFDAQRDVVNRKLLFDRDICSITTIVNGDGETLQSSWFWTLPKNDAPYYGVELKSTVGKSWEWDDDPENAIAVTGRWAFSVTPPRPVSALCRWLAATMYKTKDNVLQSGSGASVAASMDILAGDLPPDIRILMRFVPRRSSLGV